MSLGGINPYSFNAYSRNNPMQSTGRSSTPFGVSQFSASGGSTGSSGEMDWGSLFQGLQQQFASLFPGAATGTGEDSGSVNSEEKKSKDKWKAILQSSARVQDNVEAVKVTPADDSGYYAALGYE